MLTFHFVIRGKIQTILRYVQKPSDKETNIRYCHHSLQYPPVTDEVSKPRQPHVKRRPEEVPDTRNDHPPFRTHQFYGCTTK